MATILDPRPAGPTDALQLAALEKYIGHSLPKDYREFLLQFNGGRPDPNAFTLQSDYGEDEDVVHCFFPMRDLALGEVEGTYEGLPTWPLHCAWDDLQNDLENLYELELDPPVPAPVMSLVMLKSTSRLANRPLSSASSFG